MPSTSPLDGPSSLGRRPFRTHAVLTADEEGRIVFWSSSARELFGHEPAEVIGRSVAMLTDGDMLTGADVERRVIAVRKDGTRFTADVVREAFDAAGQRLVTMTIYAGDDRGQRGPAVDERSGRSEEEYRRLVQSFNEVQQFAHVGTFEHDLRDGTIRWSDELYRIFGLEPQSRSIERDFFFEHIQREHQPELRAATEEALRTGVPLDVKVGMLRVDGGERVIRLMALPLRDEHGQPVRLLGSVLDVTADEIAIRERLDLQRELDDAKRMASLGRLAATMAHEFNNVLTGISSFASYLIRRTTDEDTRRAATHIQQALRRGKSITDEILRYTRASEPLLALIDVRAWLESFLPEAMALTGGRVTLQADDGVYIRGDVAQLNQVLANLVLNARDASPGMQPIAIRAMIGADSGTPVPMLDLAVVDQGSGIPAEIRERIFEPLFTTKRSGTGLGLAVVHQVIRAHGGAVRVRSEVGEGTEFHLMLPLTEAPSQQQQVMLEKKVAKMSVLLADDNEAFAAGTIDLMTMEGIRARAVFRGGDVLAAIETEVPDALILDVGLPDMRGTDLYPTIARRWPQLPVIFVSGHHREEHVERLLVQPHVAFLEKPFEVDQLLSALARVVAAAA